MVAESSDTSGVDQSRMVLEITALEITESALSGDADTALVSPHS